MFVTKMEGKLMRVVPCLRRSCVAYPSGTFRMTLEKKLVQPTPITGCLFSKSLAVLRRCAPPQALIPLGMDYTGEERQTTVHTERRLRILKI